MPICLLKYLYKWITKYLTIRLELMAGRIIHKSQTTFLKGRNIMNSVLALHEILHKTKKTEGDRSGIKIRVLKRL
jgi:hypothetical protein